MLSILFANPCTPVRFRYSPPSLLFRQISCNLGKTGPLISLGKRGAAIFGGAIDCDSCARGHRMLAQGAGRAAPPWGAMVGPLNTGQVWRAQGGRLCGLCLPKAIVLKSVFVPPANHLGGCSGPNVAGRCARFGPRS